MSEIRKRFGELLRLVRNRSDVSQESLANIAGLHRTYISSVERGERNVTLETIEKLAIALNVKLAELMPDERAMSKVHREKKISTTQKSP